MFPVFDISDFIYFIYDIYVSIQIFTITWEIAIIETYFCILKPCRFNMICNIILDCQKIIKFILKERFIRKTETFEIRRYFCIVFIWNSGIKISLRASDSNDIFQYLLAKNTNAYSHELE